MAKRGVGFGGSLKQFRLYFDASLERGSSMRSDATYADGVLTASEDFEIQCLEVWGCGGKEAVVAMEEWKETQSEKRRRSVRRSPAPQSSAFSVTDMSPSNSTLRSAT